MFMQKYAQKYFVVKNDFEHGKCRQLLEYVGDFLNAFEFRDIIHFDQTHWLIQILNGYRMKKLYFTNCNFENVEKTLSTFMNLTHLALDGGCGYGFAHLPNFQHLKEFQLCYFDGMFYHTECEKIIQNNHQLECIDIVGDSFYTPWQIIQCINQNSLNLNKLRIINEAFAIHTDSIDEFEKFVNTSIQLITLGLSTDNHSVQLLQCLSLNCQSIKHLELFHVDHTLSNEMVDVIGSFVFIEYLTLVFKSYEEQIVSIVQHLSNLTQLSVTYRVQTPTTNNYILHFLKKCQTLEKIVIDTHIDRFKPKQPSVDRSFIEEFHQISHKRRNGVILEIKEQGKTLTMLNSQKES